MFNIQLPQLPQLPILIVIVFVNILSILSNFLSYTIISSNSSFAVVHASKLKLIRTSLIISIIMFIIAAYGIYRSIKY